MARPRSTPPLDWLITYLESARLEVDPEQAPDLLDADQWRRLQNAWRAHQHRQRQPRVPNLTRNSWARLEVLRRRVGAKDLDEAILILHRMRLPNHRLDSVTS